MNDNEVKNAFDHIEPESGAQERMYANILKKAAAQKEDQNAEENIEEKQPTVQKHKTIPMWRRWGSLAACLAIVIVAGFTFPHFFDRSESDNPPVFVGAPFEDVDGPEGFEKLGFTIDAPENAENVYYCIYDGKIARVDFTLNGHEYTYEAAQLDGNFSRAEGDAVGSTALNAEYGATLDSLSPDTWRAHWSKEGVNYYLSNFDGASEEAITAAAEMLMGQN